MLEKSFWLEKNRDQLGLLLATLAAVLSARCFNLMKSVTHVDNDHLLTVLLILNSVLVVDEDNGC